jgi:hypothetical protein
VILQNAGSAWSATAEASRRSTPSVEFWSGDLERLRMPASECLSLMATG